MRFSIGDLYPYKNQVEEAVAMDQIVHQMPTQKVAKNSIEIVVHIVDALDDKQRNNLVVTLENTKGIASAMFCHLRDHLMLIRYDRDLYSSHDVLERVTSQNISARLIGPI
jgi:hypothetical protein